MLSKGHRLAHICLRCRRNLARQSSWLLQSSTTPPPNPPSLRHQSTAAARAIDDNYDEAEQPVEVPEYQPAGLLENLRRKNRRHRQFKPTPTAGLNVQTLGKPSEIILLPDRDRIIPKSAEGDDAPRQHLSEALEEEKIPAPWEQVKEHIDQTRAALAKQQGLLDEDEWQKLRFALQQRFTRYQLKRYIREAMDGTAPESLESLKRPKLAFLIATRIWGYDVPEMKSAASTPNDGAVKDNSKEVSKQRFIRHRDDLLLFRRNEAMGFSRIARETNTSISVGEHQAVKVTGSPQNVASAMKQLDLRKVRLKDVSLEGFGEHFFADGKKEALNTLLKSAGTDLSVVLRATATSGISVRHFRSHDGIVARVRRQLRSTAKAIANSQQPSAINAAHPDRVRLASYYPIMSVPWSTNPEQWARAFDASVAVLRGSSDVEKVGSQRLASQWATIKNGLSHSLLSKARQDPNGHRCELSTRIGMNLHQVERMTKATGSSHIPATSWFVDEAPLVAQVLAGKDFRRLDLEPGQGDLPIPSPMLAKVLLTPVALLSTAPTIEIYLYGADRSLGMRQGLNVARITAVTGQKILNVSLPGLPVDMSWTRHLKQDLFVQRSPGTSKYPGLLQDIGKYLARARKEKHEEPDFAYFEEFFIPPGLISSHPTLTASSSEDKRPRTSQKVEYVLASAEILDVQHYVIPASAASTAARKDGVKMPAVPVVPATPTPILQYTTFHAQHADNSLDGRGARHAANSVGASGLPTLPSSSSSSSSSILSASSHSGTPATRERHELSIVEVPVLSPPAVKSPLMDDYQRATLLLADKIAELGRRLRVR